MKLKELEVDNRVGAVLMAAKEWALGGSRLIAPETCTPESDWDFIVLLPPEGPQRAMLHAILEANLFVKSEMVQYDQETKTFQPPDTGGELWELIVPGKDWASPTQLDVDMILLSEADYRKWDTAGKVCKALHLTARKDRVMVYRAIRTGLYFEPKKEMEDAIHSE